MNTSYSRAYTNTALLKGFQQKVQVVEGSIARLSQILSLAGNEVRLKILYLLEQETQLCVCDLGDILNMTIPAVSQHLGKLKDGNVIQSRR